MKTIAEIFRSYGVLDAQGRHTNGTDKMTNHNYGDAYANILCEWRGSLARSSVKLMMEVGIADGSSLLAWRDIFPNAYCVGMDIHDAARLPGQERVEFWYGSQCEKEDCDRAVAGRKFDFIVEDATHQLEDSLRTLLYLWPHVAPGGLYIIEEFANIGALRANIAALWPFATIVDTTGPFGGIEPLVVFRKPMWSVEFPKQVDYKPLHARCPMFPKGEQCALQAGHAGSCKWERGD